MILFTFEVVLLSLACTAVRLANSTVLSFVRCIHIRYGELQTILNELDQERFLLGDETTPDFDGGPEYEPIELEPCPFGTALDIGSAFELDKSVVAFKSAFCFDCEAMKIVRRRLSGKLVPHGSDCNTAG